MSLESNKTVGGIGAILLAIPFLNLIGIILVLIALKGMAEHYRDNEIFNSALYGFIFGIVAVLALVTVIIMAVYGFAVTPFAGFGLVIIALLVLYVFSLISAVFYRKSLSNLSEKSKEQMFNTAGLILLIGAAIPIFGEILKFVAWILVAVGFFSIRESAQQPQLAPPSPPAFAASEERKYCQYCGVQIQSDATFCQKCGNKIT